MPKDRMSKQKTTKFNIPIYSNGIGDNALYGWTDEAKINVPCVTITGRGVNVGNCDLREEPFFPIVRLICAIPNHEILRPKYLKYSVKMLKFQIPTSGIPQLTVPMVSDYKIPIPSLEEQEKIVEILDRFETITTSLTNGLPAEIAARKKQYEYYRDKLLTF